MEEYFFRQIRDLLGGEYSAFREAYDSKPRHKALRVNTLKISTDEFEKLCAEYERRGVREYALKKNALCDQSYYSAVKPSLDPLYHAGLYYMQEPSASAAVAAFAPFIGSRVLDMCAAPGGKSTQAAGFMNGRGVLFCNDVEYKRVNVLRENLERLGIGNAVVTFEKPDAYLENGLSGFFDTVMVDAPCSGGGMMRYESVPYTPEIVAGCAKRQREILDTAFELLCPGGYMLYSTCTFAPEEDEDNVEYLAKKGMTPVEIPLLPGEVRGIDIAAARRIYPHNFDGEGHFFCVLKKNGEPSANDVRLEKRVKREKIAVGGAVLYAEKRGESGLYIKDFDVPFIAKSGVAARRGKAPFFFREPGVPVYEPYANLPENFSHALTHALNREQLGAVGTVELGASADAYIRGAELDIPAPKGMRIATVDGYALGWVKSTRNGIGEMVLKNCYPKALRIIRNAEL